MARVDLPGGYWCSQKTLLARVDLPGGHWCSQKTLVARVDLPGVLMESEDPGGEGRSARGTDVVRRPWWRG